MDINSVMKTLRKLSRDVKRDYDCTDYVLRVFGWLFPKIDRVDAKHRVSFIRLMKHYFCFDCGFMYDKEHVSARGNFLCNCKGKYSPFTF
jgi:hypothetical protein